MILLIVVGRTLADTDETTASSSSGSLDQWAEAVMGEADEETIRLAPELRALIEQIETDSSDESRVQDADSLVDSFLQSYSEGEGETRADAFINHFAETHTTPEDDPTNASGFMERARAAIGQPTDGLHPLFVLTTFAIGESAMRAHFDEAAQMDRPVIFVVRGFDPDNGGLQGLVDQMLAINKWEVDVEIHVNPVFFSQYEAERGPVFVMEGEDGVTRIRRGQVNLTFAEESIRDGELDLVVGETRAIEEPDLLAIMRDRAESFTGGEEIVQGAIQRAQKRIHKARASLPQATQDESYLVDPAITLNHDITLPDGTLVAAAGSTVNPLDYAPWSMQVVVFDATNDWQLEQALQWDAEHEERTIFITTQYPESIEDQERLADKMPAHLNLLDELVVNRMSLKAIPSLIRQEGHNVRVMTKKAPVEDS